MLVIDFLDLSPRRDLGQVEVGRDAEPLGGVAVGRLLAADDEVNSPTLRKAQASV